MFWFKLQTFVGFEPELLTMQTLRFRKSGRGRLNQQQAQEFDIHKSIVVFYLI
jgi:hypothetical protein